MTIFDLGVMVLSFAMGGVILGLALYFFFGFVQTGQGVLNLLSAFALCMGFGTLLAAPFFLLAFLARRTRNDRYSKRGFWMGLALILPWLAVSLVFVFQSALPLLYGIGTLCVSFILTYWVVWRLFMGPSQGKILPKD
ncbi:MAG: hypothetical protein ACPGVT_07610 [Maricaulaceae bacterium]